MRGTVAVEAPVVVTPSLAYVAPGVEVVADWDAPVVFADNFYWAFDGGVWYRSEHLGGPRIVVNAAPYAVMQIREPMRYAHYHAPAGVARRSAPRYEGHRQDEHRQEARSAENHRR
ncbi:MAG: hypothetical protein ACREBE_02085 [bacterium]